MIRSNSHTPAKRAFFALQVLAIVGFFALVCGCSSGASKKRGSKLSEAAAEAAKEPPQREAQKRKDEKERKDEDTPTLYVSEDDDDDDDGGFVVLSDDPEPQPVPQQDSGVGFLHIGLLSGGGTLGGNDFDGFGLFGLQFGGYAPNFRVRWDIAGLGMPMNITEAATGVGGLTDETEWAVDFSLRRYLTPDRSNLGVYVIGGFRFGVLTWLYENPIEVDVDGTTEIVQSDFLKTYGLSLGVGTSIGRVKYFHVGVQGLGGVRFYSGTTHEGFENDIFDTDGFLQLALEITFASFKTD